MKSKYKFLKTVIIGVIIYITAGGVLIFDHNTLGGKNLQFYTKWIECGQRPMEIRYQYKKHSWYEKGAVFKLMLRSEKWYCTPLEAEKAGLSASPHNLEYPHLAEGS